MNRENKKHAFVIMPFSPTNSEKNWTEVFDLIFRPALEECGYHCTRAEPSRGSLIATIVQSLIEADLVVADVTDRNPNVFYELGVRHSLRRGTIIVAQGSDHVPSDLRGYWFLTYGLRPAEVANFKTEIKRIVASYEENRESSDSPVSDYLDRERVRSDQRTRLNTVPDSTISLETPRQLVIRGTAKIAQLISKAYGPIGTNVWIKLPHRGVVSSRQGIMIADASGSTNSIENGGIEQMRRVARSVYQRAGDGTKTAMLIFDSLVQCGQAALDAAHSQAELLSGMEMAISLVLASLVHESVAVSPASLLSVARSAAGDDELGSLIVDAMRAAGKDGLVTIEHGSANKTELRVQEGLRFDRGYVASEFVTDQGEGLCVLEDSSVFLCDRKLSSMKDLFPLLEKVAKAQLPLLIIAEDIQGEALSTLIVNKLRGTLRCAAVKAPGIGDRRAEILKDIAILTGGKVFAQDLGLSLQVIQLTDLGRAERIVISKESTTILGGQGEADNVKSHVDDLRAAIDRAKDFSERATLQQRLTNLAGNVATIVIGGPTELDAEDQRYRAESGLRAAYAAIEQGCVLGGGVPLLSVVPTLQEMSHSSEGQKAGVKAVADAIQRPFISLVESCGGIPASVIAERATLGKDHGFNVYRRLLEDFRESGILDATKTVSTAVRVGFSFARVVLQTDAWNVDDMEERQLSNESSQDWFERAQLTTGIDDA